MGAKQIEVVSFDFLGLLFTNVFTAGELILDAYFG